MAVGLPAPSRCPPARSVPLTPAQAAAARPVPARPPRGRSGTGRRRAPPRAAAAPRPSRPSPLPIGPSVFSPASSRVGHAPLGTPPSSPVTPETARGGRKWRCAGLGPVEGGGAWRRGLFPSALCVSVLSPPPPAPVCARGRATNAPLLSARVNYPKCAPRVEICLFSGGQARAPAGSRLRRGSQRGSFLPQHENSCCIWGRPQERLRVHQIHYQRVFPTFSASKRHRRLCVE